MPKKTKNWESDERARNNELSELIKRKNQENKALKKLLDYLHRQEEPPPDDPREYNPEMIVKRRSSE